MCLIFLCASILLVGKKIPYRLSAESFAFVLFDHFWKMQISIQKDNHLEMETNSRPGQGKTFSSMRIWQLNHSHFCDQWGETRRVNSCRNFSFIKLKYFQLYVVGEMLFFLLLRNYLHVRARWVGLWFFFLNLICLLNFIYGHLFLDVILFCLA